MADASRGGSSVGATVGEAHPRNSLYGWRLSTPLRTKSLSSATFGTKTVPDTSRLRVGLGI